VNQLAELGTFEEKSERKTIFKNVMSVTTNAICFVATLITFVNKLPVHICFYQMYPGKRLSSCGGRSASIRSKGRAYEFSIHYGR